MNAKLTSINSNLRLRICGDAKFSDDGVYRYWLTRWWAEPTQELLWVMLNPSTATATVDDHTVRRCVDHSKRWGWSGLKIVNLYALCTTRPAELWKHASPVGTDNDEVLRQEMQTRRFVVLAWGNLPRQARKRSGFVLDLASFYGNILWCLGRTRNGNPRHPSRSANMTEPTLFQRLISKEAS